MAAQNLSLMGVLPPLIESVASHTRTSAEEWHYRTARDKYEFDTRVEIARDQNRAASRTALADALKEFAKNNSLSDVADLIGEIGDLRGGKKEENDPSEAESPRSAETNADKPTPDNSTTDGGETQAKSTSREERRAKRKERQNVVKEAKSAGLCDGSTELRKILGADTSALQDALGEDWSIIGAVLEQTDQEAFVAVVRRLRTDFFERPETGERSRKWFIDTIKAQLDETGQMSLAMFLVRHGVFNPPTAT